MSVQKRGLGLEGCWGRRDKGTNGADEPHDAERGNATAAGQGDLSKAKPPLVVRLLQQQGWRPSRVLWLMAVAFVAGVLVALMLPPPARQTAMQDALSLPQDDNSTAVAGPVVISTPHATSRDESPAQQEAPAENIVDNNGAENEPPAESSMEDNIAENGLSAESHAEDKAAEADDAAATQPATADGSAGDAKPDGWTYSEQELRDYCGTWIDDYRKLHNDVVEGRAPPRFAVTGCFSGLADDLVGGMTIFYYALLSGRAFQWNFANRETAFEWGYAAPRVNWTTSRTYRAIAWDSDKNDWTTINPPEPDDDKVVYYGESMESRNEAEEPTSAFLRGDMVSFGEGYESVYVRYNAGFTYRLFDNKKISQKLRDMGLRPETAYGCALNFLVEPLPTVKQVFAREFEAITAPGALRIGIQIRRGDHILNTDYYEDQGIDSFKPFFECAQQIEDSRRQEGQPVVWYLVTDSMRLRGAAREKYGEKLITKTEGLSMGHIAPQSEGGGGGQSNFISSVGENWLFGMADFHVITSGSGFGKTGAWRGLKDHVIYTISENHRRDCGLDMQDDLRELASEWQGI